MSKTSQTRLSEEFDHVHVSSYYLQQRLRPGCRQLFARAGRLGLTTSLDPGYDPSESWAQDLVQTLEATDLFFPNEVEALAITRSQTPEQSLQVLANDRTLTVVKLGAQGCLAMHEGQLLRQPAFPVKPVDTTGAGDSFNAGFLHAWLRRLSLPDSLRIRSRLWSSLNAQARRNRRAARRGRAGGVSEQDADCFVGPLCSFSGSATF